jgi:hypothetical protein
MTEHCDDSDMSRHVWQTKYRYVSEKAEMTVAESWRRIAGALAAIEPNTARAGRTASSAS